MSKSRWRTEQAYLTTLLWTLLLTCTVNADSLSFLITTTWNNVSLPSGNYANISLASAGDDVIVVTATARYYGNPQPSGAFPGANIVGLWDYEVMDVFLANAADQYIQVQLAPDGLHCVLLFDGVRQNVRFSLPPDSVDFSFVVDPDGLVHWETRLALPTEYLPPSITTFNAYSSHGVDDGRLYEAYSPAPFGSSAPDFHALQYYAPIDLDQLIADLSSRPMTELWTDALEGRLRYRITTYWNGTSVPHAPLTVVLEGDEEEVLFTVDAPFFDADPAPGGTPGHAFPDLYKYEVVEVYFLNADNQYVEVEVGPYGQHWVLLLWTQNDLYDQRRHSLPLDVTTTITQDRWTATARIPVDYLPPKVNRFNAFGQHVAGAGRHEESLYPQLSSDSAADFHALRYFKSFDMNSIVPGQSDRPMSQLWVDTVQTPILFRYFVDYEWNSAPVVAHQPAEILLYNDGDSVRMNVTAAFFSDPAPPGGTPGQPYPGLYDYEVVEMFFLNAADEYLEVELAPHGEHLLLLLAGERNIIASELSLDYTVDLLQEGGDGEAGLWHGSAVIPAEYFPVNVTRINAYAIHGVNESRTYEALYPAPMDDPNYPQPDFHRLELFQGMDFEFLRVENSDYSDLWLSALANTTAAPLAAPAL